MTDQRSITTTTIDWEGITLLISYEPDWLNIGEDFAKVTTAHLEIRSISPEKAPLPITETGYRSHFTGSNDIDEAGGPVAYVTAWLDHMARSKEWKYHVESSRQLSLF